MSNIPITPSMNYKVELEDGEYIPVALDILEFGDKGKPYLRNEGWAELYFYMPTSNNKLSLKFRSLDVKYLSHLKFPNPVQEAPKIFIHKSLAELLGNGNLSEIPESCITSAIKNAEDIQDYQKYFEIFRSKEEPRDLFSRFAGSALFP